MVKKAKKKEAKKAKRGEYDDKLVVTGSFLDIMTAAGKNAAANNAAKKKP